MYLFLTEFFMGLFMMKFSVCSMFVRSVLRSRCLRSLLVLVRVESAKPCCLSDSNTGIMGGFWDFTCEFRLDPPPETDATEDKKLCHQNAEAPFQTADLF